MENKLRRPRVLVVAAHPDDPEFSCAATLAKWAQEGKHITYLVLTSGDNGSRDHVIRAGELAARREEEQRRAARELGVADVIFLHHQDGLLENNLALRRELTWHIRQYQPDILVAIDPWRRYQLHPDHRAAGQAALDAVFAAREWNVFPEQILGDRKPWRVKEIFLYWTDAPDYWEDVSATIDRRLAAVARHVSQVGDRIEQVSKRIRDTARTVGQEHGYEYSEALKHIKL